MADEHLVPRRDREGEATTPFSVALPRNSWPWIVVALLGGGASGTLGGVLGNTVAEDLEDHARAEERERERLHEQIRDIEREHRELDQRLRAVELNVATAVRILESSSD